MTSIGYSMIGAIILMIVATIIRKRYEALDERHRQS
jgi:hypothetical protein